MPNADPDHYATLGLDRGCTLAQIRSAYRLLSKRHHPDVNGGSREAVRHAQALNAAYETLSDEVRRRAYDRELVGADEPEIAGPTGRVEHHIDHDVHLRIEDFLRGTSLEICIKDPANPNGPEIYQLEIPAMTAPGARFDLPRAEPFAGGKVRVRARVLPGFRFKPRGSDLRVDLRIEGRRAAQGGHETIAGPFGGALTVTIPAGVGRGTILRMRGEGLPKPRGGRGDLLIRIRYRPEVRVTRRASA